jgi:glycosyltransferase involved in cell wall biosynthesis
LIDLIFVGDRCCDHSPSSGYDQVCSLFPEAGWLSGFELEAGRLTWHREREIDTTSALRIFHVFYGDCSGKLLPQLLRRRFHDALIISSVHQPIERLLADDQACAAIRMSDAIITVSEVQARELDTIGLDVPIYAIPHGVWTNAFRLKSAQTGQARKDVLLIGSYLRDWVGANQVVERLAQDGVRSIALGASAKENLVAHNACVEFSPRVSEAELALIYERSAAVFLPFIGATASNALLEAMAAGCPVICPRLPSLVDEYLGDESDAYNAGRYDIAVARLLHFVRNPSDREAKRHELMTRADKFDWSRLKQRFTVVYEEVAASAEGKRRLRRLRWQ